MLFPASENALILFYKKEAFPSLKRFITVKSEKDVIALNKYQILSAEDIIISKDAETLAEAIIGTASCVTPYIVWRKEVYGT